MIDALSGAIDELGLRSASFRRFSVRGAWGLRYREGVPGIHIVESGRAWLRGWGDVRLEAGDVFIVPRSLEHVLTANERVVDTPEAAALAHEQPGDGPVVVNALGDGPGSVLACATFDFDAKDHPMLASMPPAFHIRRTDSAAVDGYAQAILAELKGVSIGTNAVVARLTELMLVEAIRQHCDRAVECPAGGWFRGLKDPALTKVLGAFHQDVSAPWSVDAMARVAGQSRSTFAARFSEVMGETPLAFVKRWRMFHARRLLRMTDASLEEIAGRVGYGSAAALSAAFLKEHDASPGAYRAQRRG